jgi:hypothetical protein
MSKHESLFTSNDKKENNPRQKLLSDHDRARLKTRRLLRWLFILLAIPMLAIAYPMASHYRVFLPASEDYFSGGYFTVNAELPNCRASVFSQSPLCSLLVSVTLKPGAAIFIRSKGDQVVLRNIVATTGRGRRIELVSEQGSTNRIQESDSNTDLGSVFAQGRVNSATFIYRISTDGSPITVTGEAEAIGDRRPFRLILQSKLGVPGLYDPLVADRERSRKDAMDALKMIGIPQ